MPEAMVAATRVVKEFPVGKGFLSPKKHVHAVNGVDFTIDDGKVVGLVGESGCGKTTLGRLILRLIPLTSGSIKFKQEEVATLRGRSLKAFRRQTAMVFQDPYSSLNPRMLIADVVAEPLLIHHICDPGDRDDVVLDLLNSVGLKEEHMYRYPHEFSGGQRQRIAVARALAADPSFIVLDEPTSALDVSVQAKILNLLNDLKEEHHLTYLFISHDLDVVRHISDAVGVMYLGKMVEWGSTGELFTHTLHPYAQALLEAIPKPDPTIKGKTVLVGEVPSAVELPSGCFFHPRCPRVMERCKTEMPPTVEVRSENDMANHGAESHTVACHLYPAACETETMGTMR